jgi:6-phosphogluconolactonase
MKIQEFDNKAQLEIAFVAKITELIEWAISKYGEAHILLSGGSSPKSVYSQLSEEKIDWSKVIVGLVDERFVDSQDKDSNERMIRSTLCQNNAKKVRVLGMVSDLTSLHNNLLTANSEYKCFVKRIDVTILGMGEDGHTASMFPDDEQSELLLQSTEIGLFNTVSPNYPFNRITCSKEMLSKSENSLLLISGEKKREVFENAESSKLPIYYIAKEFKNLEVYYSK